jgi:hypothetical protein
MHQITFPGSANTVVFGVNDRAASGSDVVGRYEDPEDGLFYAFVKYGSAYLTVEIPQFCSFTLTGINNARLLSGWSCTPDPLATGIWSEGFAHLGSSREHAGEQLEVIAVPGASETYVHGLNDAESFVGAYRLPGDFVANGFVFQGGVYTGLPPLEGFDVWATDINNAGQVAGTVYEHATGETHGFVFAGGQYQFFAHPVSTYAWVNGLNDHGHIVGTFFVFEWEDSEQVCCWRGFLFKHSTFTTLNITKDAQTFANGINNAGNIVGVFRRPGDGWVPHGFRAVPKPPPKPKKVAAR